MKELSGSATATTSASPQQCLSLLLAVDRYPSWHGDVVKRAEVLERDQRGHPSKVRTTLHVERGPLTRDFELTLSVSVVPPGTVKLNRIPHEPPDQERFEATWRLNGGPATEIRLELAADLDVPRFVPLGGVGDSMAQGFVEAARRALGG